MNRFKFENKSIMKGAEIITDTETGVQYLHTWFAHGSGLTLLVDREGKPLIHEKYK